MIEWINKVEGEVKEIVPAQCQRRFDVFDIILEPDITKIGHRSDAIMAAINLLVNLFKLAMRSVSWSLPPFW